MGGYLLGIDSIGRICFRIDTAFYFAQLPATPGLPNTPILFDNNCHHIAVKRLVNQIKFYLDGTFVSSTMIATGTNFNSGGYTRMGIDNVQYNTNALYGQIDYVRIWNYAVKDQDIQNNQLHYIGSSDTSLLAGWYFTQNPDTIVYDHSSYLHHGLIVKNYNYPVNNGPNWIVAACGSDEGLFYLPEPAADSTCVNNPDPIYCHSFNFICNGDFEQEKSMPGSFPLAAFGGCTAAGSSNEVNNWCATDGVPAYYGRNTMNFNFRLPLNIVTISDNCAGGVDTWNGTAAGNDHYAILNYYGSNVTGGPLEDVINTTLITPLLPNTAFQLRFMARFGFEWQLPAPLNPAFLHFDLINTGTNATFGIGALQIPPGCSWNQYQITFTTPLFPGGFNMLRVGVAGTNDPNSHYFFYVDDFELFEVKSDYPVWLKGTGSQRPQEITTDASGNTYVAGYANQEILYPNSQVQGIPDEGTGFIASFDACGNQRWAHNTNLAGTAYLAVHYSNTQQLVYSVHYDAGGLSICSVDPLSGNILSTLPLPATSSTTSVIKTKYYAPTDEWYILTKDGISGLYNIFFYNFSGNILLSNPSPVFLPDDLVDFSISTPTTLCLLFNQNATAAYFQYPAARASLTGGTQFPVVNNSATGTVYLRAIDQNSNGIACIGGEYQGGSILAGGTTIAQYTTPSTLGNYTNAFTFLFDLSSQSIVANSGRFFGNDGISKVLEIVTDPQGDFITSGIIEGSGFTVPQFSTMNNLLLPNPQSRGLIVSKLDGTSGDDIWVQQGITNGIGQWSQHISPAVNSSILLTGYLNGSIDFQQGDIWTSTVECDNTYLLKVHNGQNQGIIERPIHPLNSANHTNPGSTKNHAIFVNKLSDLFEYYASLFQHPCVLYDSMGKVIFHEGENGLSFDLTKLDLESGMYILRPEGKNESTLILLSK